MLTNFGIPAVFAYGSAPSNADWCAAARVTTGLPISFDDQRSGGVLAVDGQHHSGDLRRHDEQARRDALTKLHDLFDEAQD